MTDEEYYRRWADEYSESAKVLQERISRLRKAAKKASGTKLQIITHDITVLQEAYYECTDIVKQLRKKAVREKAKAERRLRVGI